MLSTGSQLMAHVTYEKIMLSIKYKYCNRIGRNNVDNSNISIDTMQILRKYENAQKLGKKYIIFDFTLLLKVLNLYSISFNKIVVAKFLTVKILQNFI